MFIFLVNPKKTLCPDTDNLKFTLDFMAQEYPSYGNTDLRMPAYQILLGLYRIFESITNKFPNVLFEGCSGGGGRFDPGILYYMPQIWTSDNTDAVERLKIQYGTSLVYPIISMTAHVSVSPNHQLHRITPFETRGAVAMSGNFGYELDLTTSDTIW